MCENVTSGPSWESEPMQILRVLYMILEWAVFFKQATKKKDFFNRNYLPWPLCLISGWSSYDLI